MANGDIEATSTAKATTAVSTAGSAVGVATAAVGAGTLFNSISTLAGSSFGSSTKLPLANVLHKYASMTHVFTLAALDTASLNAPEMTYIKGAQLPIVLKTGGSNANNRVKTAFGKFDFYIDELTINSTYGMMQGIGNTNATNFDIKISEPASMGMLQQSLNAAAYAAGYADFRNCAFLLKIEFKGEDQSGTMVSIPNTTKYLPIKIQELSMSVSESGAVYKCTAISASDVAMLSSNCTLPTSVTISGSSVVEILQSGPNSLQAVLNRRLQEVAQNAKMAVADEIIILFPGDSDNLLAAKPGEDEKISGANATAPLVQQANDAKIFKQLNVKRSTINKTLIQTAINEIGNSDLGYDEARQAKTPAVNVAKAYDPNGYLTQSINKNVKICDYVFKQSSTIQNAINQVILSSNYGINALKTEDENGMRTWWRVETAVYHVDTTQNFAANGGKKPQIIVYKIVPYFVHVSNLPIPGVSVTETKFKKLLDQCVKVYNYIYTGMNTDILKLNLDFDGRYLTAITNDSFKNSGTAPLSQQNGVSKEANTGVDVTDPNAKPEPPSRGYNPIVGRNSIGSSQDWRGGGGEETSEHKAARTFHDALTYGLDLQQIEMDIVGDPYWLTGSGLGNFVVPGIPKKMNLARDGTVNYRNGEVDIAINFRTPVDINSATGMYNMVNAGPGQFSGLYRVKTVIHRFRDGQFTQTIKANRRQILPSETRKATSFNVSKSTPVVLGGDNTNAPPATSDGGDRGTRGGR